MYREGQGLIGCISRASNGDEPCCMQDWLGGFYGGQNETADFAEYFEFSKIFTFFIVVIVFLFPLLMMTVTIIITTAQ
jgi:hypothetical protein